jgi:imidazole glycerol-phosphate synthase subunit HisF
MFAKRIVPCLDVKDGRVVKGIHFVNLRDAGDPVEQARIYDRMGADELVFLDISATPDGRRTTLAVVQQIAEQVFLPLTVGGGIRSVDDIRNTLLAGADKVSINSAAVKDPALLTAGRKTLRQPVYCAGDRRQKDRHNPQRMGGLCQRWAHPDRVGRAGMGKRGVAAGAGEILLTSMDRDGTRDGFDLPLTAAIASAVSVPVIASGGAGSKQDFVDVFQQTQAEAALAATLFHDKLLTIADLKQYLATHGVPVRIVAEGGHDADVEV